MIIGFLHSVEFYVICVIVAAAVIAFFIRPAGVHEALQFLEGSQLSDSGNDTPSIEIHVNDDLSVTLLRYGLHDIYSDGAVSLVVNIKGNDIVIEERLTSGHYSLEPMDTAIFKFDFLSPGRYHMRYESIADGGLFATTPLPLRPGIHITKPLTK